MIMHPLRPLLLVLPFALFAACSTVIANNDECEQLETCEVCVADGEEYDVGFVYADYCGSCVCKADGEFHCSPSEECSVCSVGGVEHPDGSTWDDPSSCGLCSCSEGLVECEALACATCEWGEQVYDQGEEFPAGDACNTCTCGEDGSVGCTEIECACDPTFEWWRSYVATSPDECAVIDYVCPGLSTSFQNECGCGCEQSQECLQIYDCKPPAPCDLMWIEENCPFSFVVL